MRLQPITRKERFLYEIVGWGETAPKNELTTEELFFAKILGRNVTLPDLPNVPRYELFLAKIAGENVSVTPPAYVSPPLEFFLAKAAGMDVETPIPRTREEIFWASYTGAEIEGVPPLTFTAKAGTLSNYRIYGNMVNGESVGDKTGNLFDGEWENKYIDTYGNIGYSTNRVLSSKIHVVAGQTYTVTANFLIRSIHSYNGNVHTQTLFDEVSGVGEITFTIPNGSDSILISLKKANDGEFTSDDVEWCMLNLGTTPLPYEPYGYRVPVTVNSNTTNIYLDEQLVKSGDDADYIEYATQKRYNANGTSQSVELPTLQTVEGTNTLSVGTTVQPSKVMVNGKTGGAS